MERHDHLPGTLPPLTGEERALRERIESNDPSVTAAEYDTFVLSRGRDEVACAVRDALAGIRRDIPIASLLEVAMGTGVVTARLRELDGIGHFGIDVRPDWLRFAVAAGRTRGSDVAAADFARLPFPDGRFDAYTGVAFLNHRADPATFYAEARRVLAPNGTLFLPWVKPKADSLDREAALMSAGGFDVIRREAWYLLARKA